MKRQILLLSVALAFAALFAGCGNKGEEHIEAETEGIYLEAGGLTYQVQMSRFLNPGSVDDDEYLAGLPEGIPAQLPGDEIWFGVWMRVKNYSDETLTPTTNFTIVDTQGNEYRPIPLDQAKNPFVYEPIPLHHAELIPVPNSANQSGPIQGSLILFRLKTDDLQNRPLKLKIEAGGGEEPRIVDLDL
jgi:hypothetical protein